MTAVDALLLSIRCLLAAVFVVAAVGKLMDLGGSERALREFGVPAAAAPAGAVVLPVTELVLAGALLAQPSARWGASAPCCCCARSSPASLARSRAARRPSVTASASFIPPRRPRDADPQREPRRGRRADRGRGARAEPRRPAREPARSGDRARRRLGACRGARCRGLAVIRRPPPAELRTGCRARGSRPTWSRSRHGGA